MADPAQSTLVSSAQDSFLRRFVELKETGAYSDLTVKCGESKWNVHRAVVCTRSEYFEKACSSGFKEGETLCIEVKEIEPSMIDTLIHYLYHFDYPNGSQREADDVLETTALSVNAAMYILGDRFQLRDLKELAKIKFSHTLPSSWHWPNFPEVIRSIYENTLPTDRGLRDTLVPAFKRHTVELRACEGFMEVFRTNADFAVDILDAWADIGQPPGVFISCYRCSRPHSGFSHYCQHCGLELISFG